MKDYPFYWIDAFSNKPLSGNPCAVVLNADTISTETMQTIAREMNLSETAFVVSSNRADFGARYFTPERELPFAGHPTIATIHALIQAKSLNVTKANQTVLLDLLAGVIPVEVQCNNAGTTITMCQLAPKFMRTYSPSEVLPLFGLSSNDLLPGVPIQTVSTGTPFLLIPLTGLAALKKVKYLDFENYNRLKENGDFFFPHHFCIQGATPEGNTFARSLGTEINPLEDPFTGSATGCMAAYLWKYRLIEKPRIIAEQGHWMGRPGSAFVEVVGDPDSIKMIRVGGQAVTIIAGKITLNS